MTAPAARAAVGHDGLGGIDAHGKAHPPDDGLDGGDDTAQFVVGVHGRGPGTGRFPAHVDEVGAVGGHALGEVGGGRGVAGEAVAGERIGRHVDHAHEVGARTPAKDVAADHGLAVGRGRSVLI